MAKRTVELDEDRQETEGQRALHEAEERAERAEAELARLRRSQGLHDAVLGEPDEHQAGHHAKAEGTKAHAEAGAHGHEAAHKTRAAHDETSTQEPKQAHATRRTHGEASAHESDEAGTERRAASEHRHRGHAEEMEGDLFAGQETTEEAGSGRKGTRTADADEEETPARHAQRLVGRAIEEERHGAGRSQAADVRDEESGGTTERHANGRSRGADVRDEEEESSRSGRSTARHGRVDPEKNPGNAGEVKEPPTRSSAEGEPEMEGGEEELRNDSMMAHLLDSLEAGKDIGHYGRLVFAMVSRHFLPHEEVLAWMTKDRDFGEEEAELMLRQVEERDYSPPRRAKILEYQREQEFPILPHPHDPDCGNLYRNLKFPDAVYKHIGRYQEQKMEAEDE